MEAWLREFLDDERRTNVWALREPDGFPVWAYFRPQLAYARFRRAAGIVEPFHERNSWRHHLAGQLRLHARSLVRLPRAARGAFDAVFFTNVNLATESVADDGLVDRVHDGYFRLCRRPLIVQSPYHGRNVEYPDWPGDQYCGTTWMVLMRRVYEWRGMLRPPQAHDAEFAARIAHLAGGDCTPGSVMAALRRMRGARAFYDTFARRVILPRMRRKLAFVTFACGLGQEALLSFALHRQGFLVVEAQHGIINRNVVDYQHAEGLRRSDVAGVLPDLLLTFGEQSSRDASPLIECRAVGHHYLSRFPRQAAAGANDPRVDILVISQGGASRELSEIALGLAREFPDRRVVFKVHPTEQTYSDVQVRLAACPNVSIIRRGNVYPLLRAAPIVVGYYSLALLEAAVFPGKRIFMRENPYLPDGLGARFTNPHDLVQAIRSADCGRPTLDVDAHWRGDWEIAAREAFAELDQALTRPSRVDASMIQSAAPHFGQECNQSAPNRLTGGYRQGASGVDRPPAF